MSHQYLSGNLYRKTELRITGIGLNGVNLNDVADAVAEVLGLPGDEVLVIDARDDLMTLDVLRETLDPYLIVGRQEQLLARLAKISGLVVTPRTRVVSEGMLGWIALDRDEGVAALDRSRAMIEQVRLKLSKRVIVFSTGPEVLSGKIEDTNKPTIRERLSQDGFSVRDGANLDDDLSSMVTHLNDAIFNGGYGLVITTGGVGAEAKDMSVEALLQIDPSAATPYIAHVEQGRGRHVKDGIRIGVAQVDETLVIALPGPNDEVRIALEALAAGLKAGLDKHALAETIAVSLRAKLRQNHTFHQHHAQQH